MMQPYEAALLQERVARARLLLQLASRDDSHLADLLAFARQIGGQPPAADTLVAFREAISEELQTAQAELDRLAAPRLRTVE